MIERRAQNQSESAEKGRQIRGFSSLHNDKKDGMVISRCHLSFCPPIYSIFDLRRRGLTDVSRFSLLSSTRVPQTPPQRTEDLGEAQLLLLGRPEEEDEPSKVFCAELSPRTLLCLPGPVALGGGRCREGSVENTQRQQLVLSWTVQTDRTQIKGERERGTLDFPQKLG